MKENHDHQRMLDTAVAFFLAGERCAADISFGPYGPHHLTAPRIVSYSLALEIGLKLLLLSAGIPLPTGSSAHSIKNLHSLLPDDNKVHLQGMEDCLVDIDRQFIDWRYPYEFEFLVGELDSVRRSFIIIHEEIRRVRSDLVSVFERDWGNFSPDWQWAWPVNEIAELERVKV